MCQILNSYAFHAFTDAGKKVQGLTDESGGTSLASAPQSSSRPDVRGVLSVTVAKNNTDLITSPETSLRASIITSSSFTSKENINDRSSRTGTGRRVPTRKPMPAVFSAIHKAKSMDVDTSACDSSGDKRNSKTRVLVDLTKVVSSEPHAPPPLPLDRSMKTNVPLTPVMEGLIDFRSKYIDIQHIIQVTLRQGWKIERDSQIGSPLGFLRSSTALKDLLVNDLFFQTILWDETR